MFFYYFVAQHMVKYWISGGNIGHEINRQRVKFIFAAEMRSRSLLAEKCLIKHRKCTLSRLTY